MPESTFQLYDGDMDGLQKSVDKSLKSARKTDNDLNQLVQLSRNIRRKQAQMFQALAKDAGTAMSPITPRGSSSALFSPESAAAQKSYYANSPYRGPTSSSAINYSDKIAADKEYRRLNATEYMGGGGRVADASSQGTSNLNNLVTVVASVTTGLLALNSVLQGITQRGSEGSRKIGDINLAVSRAASELGLDPEKLYQSVKSSPDQAGSMALINQAVSHKVSKGVRMPAERLYAGLDYISGGGDAGVTAEMVSRGDPRIYGMARRTNANSRYDPEVGFRTAENWIETQNAEDASRPAERMRRGAMDRYAIEHPLANAFLNVPGAGELGIRTATDTATHALLQEGQNQSFNIGSPTSSSNPVASPVRQPNVNLGSSDRGLSQAAADLRAAASSLNYGLPNRPPPNR